MRTTEEILGDREDIRKLRSKDHYRYLRELQKIWLEEHERNLLEEIEEKKKWKKENGNL